MIAVSERSGEAMEIPENCQTGSRQIMLRRCFSTCLLPEKSAAKKRSRTNSGDTHRGPSGFLCQNTVARHTG